MANRLKLLRKCWISRRLMSAGGNYMSEIYFRRALDLMVFGVSHDLLFVICPWLIMTPGVLAY